jgi:hypothetical protein
VAVGVAASPSRNTTVARLARPYAQFVTEFTEPTNLVNFGQAVDFPLLLGLTLARKSRRSLVRRVGRIPSPVVNHKTLLEGFTLTELKRLRPLGNHTWRLFLT